ncbi:MAG: exosortase/archaeosortase family protein [Planctomycetia bacterium]|nr:exosortase/archaeosortase family protein [Planctomycetia bacterium]
MTQNDLSPSSEVTTWSFFGILLVVLIAAYWNMFQEAYFAWQGGLYSHGYLIPAISAILLWLRRKPLQVVPPWQRGVGLGVLCLAMFLRGQYCAYTVLDMWTFVLAFTALLLLTGGFSMLRWAGPVAALLLFMFPIPWQMEQALLVPMQNFATTVSTLFLQIFGFVAIQDGNTIHLADTQIGIVEQCSGLRMTTILLALSLALVLLNERSKIENVVILIFAIPIALATNITRIVVTGMVYSFFPHNPTVEKFVHDAAGIGMVPLAIAMLIGLQAILSRLLVDDESTDLQTEIIENPQEVFWRDKKKIED